MRSKFICLYLFTHLLLRITIMLLLQVISPIIVILSLWSCNCICKLVYYTVIVQFYDAMNSVYLSYEDIEINFYAWH